jgi:hypothetical protein
MNAMMFMVESGAGLAAGSASLQADALDFLGDAAYCTSQHTEFIKKSFWSHKGGKTCCESVAHIRVRPPPEWGRKR